MKLALLAFLALPLAAQQISLSPQGAEFLRSQVGVVIPSTQALGVVACGDATSQTITGGALYQQAQAQGYSYILPIGVPSITTRNVRKTKAEHVVQYLKYGSIVAATLASGSIIKVPPQVVTGLIMGHGLIDDVQPYFASRVPDPSVLLGGLIDPTKTYQIAAGTCIQGYIVALYTGQRKAPVNLKTPIPPPPSPFIQAPGKEGLGILPRTFWHDDAHPEETTLVVLSGRTWPHEDSPIQLARNK